MEIYDGDDALDDDDDGGVLIFYLQEEGWRRQCQIEVKITRPALIIAKYSTHMKCEIIRIKNSKK